MIGLNVGILGATGLVGTKLLEVLQERSFPVGSLRLLASERSAGKQIRAFWDTHRVTEANADAFSGLDLCFSAVGNDLAKRFVPEAIERGVVVIDKSSAYRMCPEVPLVVPEVNSDHLAKTRKLVCSPNCSTIQLVMALKPIEKLSRITRVLVSTMQSVSGTGKAAIEELVAQTKAAASGEPLVTRVYPKPIAFNLIPHLDDFSSLDYTLEEWKLIRETKKILGRPDLKISATCVRVPIFVGHSESVLVQTETRLDPVDVKDALTNAPGVFVLDEPSGMRYPVPLESEGDDRVFVGRIRSDTSCPNGIWLWIVADNLRKGAATNAVQIAETMLRRGLV